MLGDDDEEEDDGLDWAGEGDGWGEYGWRRGLLLRLLPME